jgi:predicted nuclease of predicted toxin-antitoxin system
MKFLLDQDVYAITARHLKAGKHDVITASERGRSRSTDLDLLKLAAAEGRVLLTRDRDFGELVFVRSSGTGVIYLRMLPTNVTSVHVELDRVLSLYSEAELRRAFVVVEPGRHRIRRLSAA